MPYLNGQGILTFGEPRKKKRDANSLVRSKVFAQQLHASVWSVSGSPKALEHHREQKLHEAIGNLQWTKLERGQSQALRFFDASNRL